MNKEKLSEGIKKITSHKHFPKILVLSGILLMLMILFSDSDEEDKLIKTSDITEVFFVSDNYTEYSERKLISLLESIEGVGKNKVMVSLSGTEEYVYAEEINQRENHKENNYVIYDSGNEKTALLKKVNNPSVTGVVVVCEGGDDPKICEQVYRVIATAFNVPTNRIYVAEMK